MLLLMIKRQLASCLVPPLQGVNAYNEIMRSNRVKHLGNVIDN